MRVRAVVSVNGIAPGLGRARGGGVNSSDILGLAEVTMEDGSQEEVVGEGLLSPSHFG